MITSNLLLFIQRSILFDERWLRFERLKIVVSLLYLKQKNWSHKDWALLMMAAESMMSEPVLRITGALMKPQRFTFDWFKHQLWTLSASLIRWSKFNEPANWRSDWHRYRRLKSRIRFPGRSTRASTDHHCCDVSSELCCPGVKSRRWMSPLVTRFGVVPRV